MRKIGGLEIHFYEERCNVCGGDIPDQIYWPELGETNNGYCPGHLGEDGFCGGFGPMTHDNGREADEKGWREEYEEWRDGTVNHDEKE